MHKDERVTDAMVEAARAEMRPFVSPNDDTLRRAIAAAIAALSSPEEEKAVKVKALEWDYLSAYPMRARTIIGDYTIWADAPRHYVDGPNGFRSNKGTVEAAKAAAQADYERRILSALVDVPAVESEPVAWYIERNGERLITDNDIIRDRWLNVGREPIPLYTHPPRTTPVPALVGEDEVERLTRPIIGIGARSPQEVFHIMADRIRFALTRKASTEEVGGSTSVATGGDHG